MLDGVRPNVSDASPGNCDVHALALSARLPHALSSTHLFLHSRLPLSPSLILHPRLCSSCRVVPLPSPATALRARRALPPTLTLRPPWAPVSSQRTPASGHLFSCLLQPPSTLRPLTPTARVIAGPSLSFVLCAVRVPPSSGLPQVLVVLAQGPSLALPCPHAHARA